MSTIPELKAKVAELSRALKRAKEVHAEAWAAHDAAKQNLYAATSNMTAAYGDLSAAQQALDEATLAKVTIIAVSGQGRQEVLPGLIVRRASKTIYARIAKPGHAPIAFRQAKYHTAPALKWQQHPKPPRWTTAHYLEGVQDDLPPLQSDDAVR